MKNNKMKIKFKNIFVDIKYQQILTINENLL